MKLNAEVNSGAASEKPKRKRDMAKEIAYTAEWKRRHPEKVKEQSRRYYIKNRDDLAEFRKEHPEIGRRRNLKYKYGITLDQFVEILVSQNNRCAICGTNDWAKFPQAVDHDHKTNRVRGVLCKWCNLALGYLKDNPDIAMSAANYLRRGDK